MIDKPRINREEALREDRRCRHVRRRLLQACALLEEGEHLGTPVREGARLVLPVLPGFADAAAGADDAGEVTLRDAPFRA